MSFLDLFRRRPTPVATFDHPRLGQLTWSTDDNGWLGAANGLTFCIANESGIEPCAQSLFYAEKMLGSPDHLLQALEQEKKLCAEKYPSHTEKIAKLAYESVYIYRFKGANKIIASLAPETAGRCWRIEFNEHDCMGLGFDS